MGFSNTGTTTNYKPRTYVKFPDTREAELSKIPEGENPQFLIASGDEANKPLGNQISGKLVSIEKNVWDSSFGKKLQCVITLEDEDGQIVLTSNMNNEMRKLLLKITQVDKIEDLSIAAFYIKADNGKRYFSTGVVADGVKLAKVDLDRDAEVAKGTMLKETNLKGESTYYYDNPKSATEDDLLGDPDFFDGMLLAKASKLGTYEREKAEYIAKEEAEEVGTPEPATTDDEDEDDSLPF